jgi:hypothetical protein
MAGGTVDDRLHALHIGLPGTIGTPMRVRDLNAESHALIAKLALCHPLHLLAVVKLCLDFHKLDNNSRLKHKMQAKFAKKLKFLF